MNPYLLDAQGRIDDALEALARMEITEDEFVRQAAEAEYAEAQVFYRECARKWLRQ